jgi:hypothetical protein
VCWVCPVQLDSSVESGGSGGGTYTYSRIKLDFGDVGPALDVDCRMVVVERDEEGQRASVSARHAKVAALVTRLAAGDVSDDELEVLWWRAEVGVGVMGALDLRPGPAPGGCC